MKTSTTVSLREAKARLSALTEEVERGAEIVIAKRGKPSARLVPVHRERKPVDLERLRKLTGEQSIQPESAGDALRTLRTGARY